MEHYFHYLSKGARVKSRVSEHAKYPPAREKFTVNIFAFFWQMSE